ncbi:MAG TPA: hypothetical protein VJA23_02240 [Candidatus Nanoarchaeia archaeon]|nr:hypothetical protein [Candidatus Nanoarchaeia archaeon]
MTNTIEQIIEIAKASGIQSIVVRNLLHKADTTLLSEFVEREVKSWDDWIWKSPDWMAPENFSRLTPSAKNKMMENQAAKGDYWGLLYLAGEDALTRPDLLIKGSKFLEEETASGQDVLSQEKGILSVYLAYLSGDKRRLKQTAETQYEHAIKGRYIGWLRNSRYTQSSGGWTEGWNKDNSFIGKYGMEDLADLLEKVGFEDKARNVRIKMLEYLETRTWSDSLHSPDVKPPKRTIREILAGEGEAEKDNSLGVACILGLYLRTAKKLDYAKELHPRAVQLFIQKNEENTFCEMKNILDGLITISREEACCSESQVQRLKNLVLEKYLKDTQSGYDSTRKSAVDNYKIVKELFQDNEPVLDQMVLAILPSVPEDQQETLLSGIKTAEGRYGALKYLYQNKKCGSGPLIAPEKIALFVDSTEQSRKLAQSFIPRYELEKDLTYAETFAQLTGMAERTEAYRQMKELAGVK